MPLSVRRQYEFAGVNTTDPDDQIEPNELSDCRNIRLEGSAIGERGGQTKLNTNAISANTVHSLTRFHKDDGSTRKTIGAVTTKLYDWSATPTEITRSSGSWTTGVKMDFAAMNNSLFIVNGTDSPEKYVSGSASVAMSGSPPTGSIIEAHPTANRLFMSGVTANPKRVYYSALDDPEDWTTTNDAGFFDVPFTEGENVKALAVAPSGILLIFSDSSTHVLQGQDQGNFNRREIDPAIGCRAPRSIAAGRGGVYFLAQNNRVYWSNGQNNVPVGKAVEGILDSGVTGQYVNAVGWVEGTRYHLAITQSGTTNNMVLVLDWTANKGRGGWVIDDSINVASVAADGVTGQVYTGDYAGFVQQQDFGTTDNGTSVSAYWDTAFDVYDEEERRKKVKRLYVKYVPSGAYNLTVSVAKDGGSFSQLSNISLVSGGAQLDSGSYGLDDEDTALDGGETEKMVRLSSIRNARSVKFRFACSNPFKFIGYSVLLRKKFPK